MGTLLSKFLYFFLGAAFLATGFAATFCAGAFLAGAFLAATFFATVFLATVFFAAGAAGAGLEAEASKANRGVCEAVIDAMSRRSTQFQNHPANTRILRSHIGMANP